MSQAAMGLKPVQVDSMPTPSMEVVSVPPERQYFKRDMAVLVNLTEMKGEVNCGDGKSVNYWGTEQRCGNTSKCFACSGLNNVRLQKTYMNEDVKAAAAGLDQAVRFKGEVNFVGTVQTMYSTIT